MINYTPWQNLLIDLANHADQDKLLFEERIEWATNNLHQLGAIAADVPAKTLPQYLKTVQEVRNAQQGLPSGHLVGFNAVCSGIQVMSALTGCYEGAKATGLVDPDRRADAYAQTTAEMQKILGNGFSVSRDNAKSALMKSFYGSRAVPKMIFGEETPELAAFYQAAHTVAPGPWDLLQVLRDSWKPWALSHAWKLPDGYDAVVKVMTEYTVAEGKEAHIEVDELDHTTFTYEYEANEGSAYGLSNIANVIHSCDGWILRSMHRRCNYDEAMVKQAELLIMDELVERMKGQRIQLLDMDDFKGKVSYYRQQYERSSVADVVVLPHLDAGNVGFLSTDHLDKLLAIVRGMLAYKPFALVSIHDEYRCHANNANHMRQQYINIMAELADSSLLDDLLSQLYERKVHFPKLCNNLSDYIRKSNYALS